MPDTKVRIAVDGAGSRTLETRKWVLYLDPARRVASLSIDRLSCSVPAIGHFCAEENLCSESITDHHFPDQANLAAARPQAPHRGGRGDRLSVLPDLADLGTRPPGGKGAVVRVRRRVG